VSRGAEQSGNIGATKPNGANNSATGNAKPSKSRKKISSYPALAKTCRFFKSLLKDCNGFPPEIRMLGFES
jgi:hypothetical protein